MRQLHVWVVAHPSMPIASANAACFDLQNYARAARDRIRNGLYCRILTKFVVDRGFHFDRRKSIVFADIFPLRDLKQATSRSVCGSELLFRRQMGKPRSRLSIARSRLSFQPLPVRTDLISARN